MMNLLNSESELRSKLARMPGGASTAALNFATFLQSSPPSTEDELKKGYLIACASGFQESGGNLYDQSSFERFMRDNGQDVALVGISLVVMGAGGSGSR